MLCFFPYLYSETSSHSSLSCHRSRRPQTTFLDILLSISCRPCSATSFPSSLSTNIRSSLNPPRARNHLTYLSRISCAPPFKWASRRSWTIWRVCRALADYLLPICGVQDACCGQRLRRGEDTWRPKRRGTSYWRIKLDWQGRLCWEQIRSGMRKHTRRCFRCYVFFTIWTTQEQI